MHLDFEKYIKPAFIEGEIGGATQKSAQKFLYNDLHPHIVRLLKNKGVQNTEDAEDIFNQAIFALYKNVQKKEFVLSTSLQNYVWAIARNIFYKKIATEKRGKDVPSEYNKAFNSEQANQWNENAFIEEINPIIKELDIWQIIKNTIEELGQPCEKLLKLRNEGKKFKEIFDLMPELKSADNAKHKTNRCKKALIKKVRNHPYYKTAKNTYYDMENRNLHDLLLKYVDGELQGDELKSFELELKSNKELQEDLEILQIMESNSEDKGLEILNKNLNEFSSGLKNVKDQEKDFSTETNLSKEKEPTFSKAKTIPLYRRTWFKMVAIFLLFPSFIVAGMSIHFNPDNLVYSYFELPTSYTPKGGQTDTSKFETLEAQMMEGANLLKTNDPEGAIHVFDEVLGRGELLHETEAEAKWYKALSYLKMRKYSECRQELESIVNNEDYPDEIGNRYPSKLLKRVKILEWWYS